MKIVVMGYSGCGKSTLTRRLGETLNIPYLHLDTVQFLPNWVDRDPEEAKAMVRAFMEAHDSWVIDGNYSRYHQKERLEQADHIVYMDFPRLRCLWRCWKRSIQYKGKVRESAARGCQEKFDLDFVSWILWKGRTRAKTAQKKNIFRTYQDKLTVCRSDRDTARFLKEVDN